MWFYDNCNSTDLYPITDATSALRTSTDAELTAIVKSAQVGARRAARLSLGRMTLARALLGARVRTARAARAAL